MKSNLKNKLKKEFYLQKTESVARQLLGKIFVSGNISGRIVETEAYLPHDDYANHSASGKSLRNAAMFEEGGILYVYKIYGIHHCINIVTEKNDLGCAVLIRAIEPINGIEIMQANRGIENLDLLCKGPGNLAKAFGFNINYNFQTLLNEQIYIYDDESESTFDIITDKRIGISKSADLMLRFYLADNSFVSGKKIK